MSSRPPGFRSVSAVVALCTAAVLLWPPPVHALDPSLNISQYAHVAWTFRNCFSNGGVYAIAQTPDGPLAGHLVRCRSLRRRLHIRSSPAALGYSSNNAVFKWVTQSVQIVNDFVTVQGVVGFDSNDATT